MATLIICPACGTRYQIKAAFPPEGRKVRCAKCGHVWQAQPAGAEAASAPKAEAPPPAAVKAPAPPSPPPPVPPVAAPEPASPPPPPVPPAAAPPPPPPMASPEPAPPPQATPPIPPVPPIPPSQAASPPPPPPPSADAEFGEGDQLTAQVARINEGALAPSEPETAEPPTKGGLFGRLMGKGKKQDTTPPLPDMAPPPDMVPPPDMTPPRDMAPPPGMAPPPDMAAPADIPVQQADASFDAGFPDEATDPALADPDLVAAAFGEQAHKAKKPGKKPPVLAIGWSVLALVVAAILGLFFFAPMTTVSMLPGATHVYSLLGIPVGNDGLAFEGVSYDWTTDGQQTVLEVQGNVRNTSASTRPVPAVVISLRDETGADISEWQTEVGATELAAGEQAPFLRQIPSPPSNVKSLKVRFAEAN